MIKMCVMWRSLEFRYFNNWVSITYWFPTLWHSSFFLKKQKLTETKKTFFEIRNVEMANGLWFFFQRTIETLECKRSGITVNQFYETLSDVRDYGSLICEKHLFCSIPQSYIISEAFPIIFSLLGCRRRMWWVTVFRIF